jgi:type II secretory pathway pseudopilin PulG
MKDKKSVHRGRSMAFTLVEILVVIGIIALLITLLIPALTAVRKMAKDTQQRAQFTTIELALTAFRNDHGDYPPSHGWLSVATPDDYFYCGAMTLTEALVGWDLLGFHPNSAWTKDGYDQTGGDTTYDPAKSRDISPADSILDTLTEREKSYLNLENANVFKLGDLFTNTSSFNPNNFVICDVFGTKSVKVGGKIVKAGAPILYYKANTSSKTIDPSVFPGKPTQLIYNSMDNYYFINNVKDGVNPLGTSFYNYIADKKITTVKWPCNPDSYLLISAGPDGLYGTKDDICNFDPNS